jgi:hypothetical protein
MHSENKDFREVRFEVFTEVVFWFVVQQFQRTSLPLSPGLKEAAQSSETAQQSRKPRIPFHEFHLISKIFSEFNPAPAGAVVAVPSIAIAMRVAYLSCVTNRMIYVR